MPRSRRRSKLNLRLLLVPMLLGLAGCSLFGASQPPGPARFAAEVRSILELDPSSAQFLTARARLERMGPEVDAVLVMLARDAAARLRTRINALSLLVDRASPAALPVLRRVLLSEPEDELRAAAVLALQRVALSDTAAMALIRGAVRDPARDVRLNALQALDIREVETIRELMDGETDREVRHVAMQLVALAEARGAPLTPDRRGALRTAGTEDDPRIVFRATRVDSAAQVATGDLRVELPDAPDISLSPHARVVMRVVPAFFSPDRSRIVYESDREVHVVELETRRIYSIGPGTAPRPVPFTSQFVFVRERPEARVEEGDSTRLVYQVLRANFSGRGSTELLGELHAVSHADRHAGQPPVHWMVVTDVPEGFVLRADGMRDFLIPSPVWRPGPPDRVRERNLLLVLGERR